MHETLSGKQAAVSVLGAVGYLVAVVLLLLSGHPTLAVAVTLTVLALGVFSWGRIYQRDQTITALRPTLLTPAGNVLFQETLKLRHAPERVWELLVEPENAPALDPNCVRSFRVPGTPRGVGEQHCFITADGATTTVETVEYAAGHRAVVRPLVQPSAGFSADNLYALERVGTGCLLTVGWRYGAVPGPIRAEFLKPEAEARIRQGLRDLLERIDRNLNSSAPLSG